MELRRFFKNDGQEAVIFPYSNNKRWCGVVFGESSGVHQIFELEKDAIAWAQDFIKDSVNTKQGSPLVLR